MKVGDLVRLRNHNNRTGIVVKVYPDAETLIDVLAGSEIFYMLPRYLGIEVISESR